jgi:hypothetical protein
VVLNPKISCSPPCGFDFRSPYISWQDSLYILLFTQGVAPSARLQPCRVEVHGRAAGAGVTRDMVIRGTSGTWPPATLQTLHLSAFSLVTCSAGTTTHVGNELHSDK